MIIVATTSLPAVDHPNADRWNAARSCQNYWYMTRRVIASQEATQIILIEGTSFASYTYKYLSWIAKDMNQSRNFKASHTAFLGDWLVAGG